MAPKKDMCVRQKLFKIYICRVVFIVALDRLGSLEIMSNASMVAIYSEIAPMYCNGYSKLTLPSIVCFRRIDDASNGRGRNVDRNSNA